MPRLFVAVRPGPEVVALLSALDRPALPGLRWSTPEQWLVKLRPLGHVRDRVVAPLCGALAAELDGAPAVACRLGPATRRLAGSGWACQGPGAEGAGRPVTGSWTARTVSLVADRSSPRGLGSRTWPTSSWRERCQQADCPGGRGAASSWRRTTAGGAMRKPRDASASLDDDDGPRLISLQDKHDADRLLQQAYAAGEMDKEELKRRRGRVYAAVTPRELWKATGHRAGSRARADKADIWRSVRLQVAIVVFAAIIMMFVLLGTILNNQGGTKNTPIFPWEWGKDQQQEQPAQP